MKNQNEVLLTEQELNSLRGGVTSANMVNDQHESTSEGDGGINCCNGKKPAQTKSADDR